MSLTRELLRLFPKHAGGKESNSKYCWEEKSYSKPDIRIWGQEALSQPFKARIKFHLLFAGIISSPFSPRLQDKG